MSEDADEYQKAFNFALDHEGRVYEDVPGDSGGPTKWGVTWSDGNRWRKDHGLTPLSIDAARQTKLAYLTPDIIGNIYYTHYWLPTRGPQVPSPLDWVLFDGAVNCGVGQSVKWMQRVLGVPDDGAFGTITLGALNNYLAKHGTGPMVAGLLHRRRDFYNQIAQKGSNAKFLTGWLNRVNDLENAIGGQ